MQAAFEGENVVLIDEAGEEYSAYPGYNGNKDLDSTAKAIADVLSGAVRGIGDIHPGMLRSMFGENVEVLLSRVNESTATITTNEYYNTEY